MALLASNAFNAYYDSTRYSLLLISDRSSSLCVRGRTTLLFDHATLEACLLVFRISDTIDGNGTRILAQIASVVVRSSRDGVSAMELGDGYALEAEVGGARFIEVMRKER